MTPWTELPPGDRALALASIEFRAEVKDAHGILYAAKAMHAVTRSKSRELWGEHLAAERTARALRAAAAYLAEAP